MGFTKVDAVLNGWTDRPIWEEDDATRIAVAQARIRALIAAARSLQPGQ